MNWQRLRGFSLVELLVSLGLGSIISLAVVQVMVSNRVTNDFNSNMAEVQESGRFIVSRIKNDLLETGLYDSITTPVAAGVDLTSEEAFVRNHPVIIANDLDASTTMSSTNGISGANDQLVISMQSETDCAGASYGAAGETIHIVNRYFVENEQLKCQGYNGRVLRGVINPATAAPAIVLMDQVKSFQVQYGLSASAGAADGSAVQYVTADQLAAAATANQMVVAIRIGVLLQSSGTMASVVSKTHTVLDVSNAKVDTNHFGQVFTYTVALRNMKNFARSI